MGSWKTNVLWGLLLMPAGIWETGCANAGDDGVDIPLNSAVAFDPLLVVDSPQRALIGNFDEIEVDGHVEHWNSTLSVFVNNQEVTVSNDGQFSFMTDMNRGTNFIETQLLSDGLVVQNDRRSILSAVEMPINTTHEDAIFLSLGENIFNHIGDIAQHAISNTDFAQEYGNTLISGEGGCSNSVWFRNLTFEDMDFNFDFAPGRLQISLSIQNPVFFIRARIARDTFFGCIRDTTNASMSNNEIAVVINYQVGTNENNEPYVQFEDANAELIGFDLDVSGYPDPFIEWLAGDVSGDLEEAIEESIEEESVEALDGALADLVPDVFSADIGNNPLTMTPHLSGFAADDNGLSLSMGLSSEADTNGLETSYWSIGAQEAMPLPPTNPDQLSVGLAFEILNQHLAMSWQQGLFDATIAAKDIPGEFNPEDDDLKDAQFRLALQPTLRHDEEHGGLVFDIGEANVIVESTHNEVLFEAALAIRANIGFARNEDTGFIKIVKNEFTGHSTLVSKPLTGVTEALIDALIEFELDNTLAETNKILRELEIEGAYYSESDDDGGQFGFRTNPSHLWFQIDPSALFPL